jgi:hypothetical protein
MLAFTSTVIALANCGGKKNHKDDEPGTFDLAADDGTTSNHLLAFRSVNEVNEILRSRVVQEQNFDVLSCLVNFEDGLLNILIGSSAKKEVAGLMGAFQGLGTRVSKDSLRPSAVHELLWGLAVQDFAREVAKSCGGKSPLFALKPEVASAVNHICDNDALSEIDVKVLWDLLLRKDVNDDDFFRWYGIERDTLAAAKGAERVQMMVHEMLFGPEFLIGR